MISLRTLTPVCMLAGALAVAQTAPPAPPSPLAAPAVAAPTPAPAPAALAEPLPAPQAPTPAPDPGMHMLLGPADSFDFSGLSDQIRAQIGRVDIDALKGQLKDLKVDLSGMDWSEAAQEAAQEAAERAREAVEKAGQQMSWANQNWSDFGKAFAFAQQTPMAPMPPMPPARVNVNARPFMRGSVDSMYERGLSALDGHRYDQALDYFTEVGSRGGSHADGALYWKAYALNKLGRRDDAIAALNTLRSSFASSRWLDDAKALEIEVKQSSGQKVSPESESNEELKLLALEGLVQSDPDRAYPILDKLLKGPQTPSLKKRAIYVLALSNSPRSQQLLEQIAKGGTGNPDLQITAIQYLGRTGKDANKAQVLFEIYNSSSDPNVKREVLRSMISNRDKDHLLQIAKSDKSAEMRQEAIRDVAGSSSGADMWALYQAETDPQVKRTILDFISGSTDRLIEVARTEKDAQLRRSAIQRLGSSRTASDALVQLYGTEQDPQVKRAIIDALANTRSSKGLVDIFHKENDPEVKKTIVRRMLDMKSPEINQVLEEILK